MLRLHLIYLPQPVEVGEEQLFERLDDEANSKIVTVE